MERRRRNKEKFYRLGTETLEERTRKKLTEKTNWFKKKKRKGSDKFKRQVNRREKNEKIRRGEETEGAKAVITVSHTHGGMLAKLLRLKEDELYNLTGYRLKIAERVGPSINSQLVKSDPWSGKDCDRADYLLCISLLFQERICHKTARKEMLFMRLGARLAELEMRQNQRR